MDGESKAPETRLDPGCSKLQQLGNRALLMYTMNNLAIFPEIFTFQSARPDRILKHKKCNLLRENKALRDKKPLCVCLIRFSTEFSGSMHTIIFYRSKILRRNPIEDGAISGFSGQKSVPE